MLNDHDNSSTKCLQRDLDFASSARAAMLQQSPYGARLLLWVMALSVFILIVWAFYAELDEFTRGEGRVIPSQSVQFVQNLEGGILAELYVAEGEIVIRGQPLLRIDDTQFSSSLREAGMRQGQLEIKAARLRAEAIGDAFRMPEGHRWDAALAARELAVHKSRMAEFNSANMVLMQQVAQKQQDVAALLAKQSQLETSYSFLRKELELTGPLAKEGAISQVELLRLKRQVNDMHGELQAAKLALPSAKAGLLVAKEGLHTQQLTFQRDARERLIEVTNELLRLTESSGTLVDRVKRTLVISPVAGVVKRLLVNTIGGVIQPGMDIVEVVPSEEILLVEVKVKPKDIAFLHPGQPAKVKFTAYDFSVMGGLGGEVVQISPDTIMDNRGDSYYQVKVETKRVFTDSQGRELPIIPGMTVSVDILTGKKTVMQYLLKPIFKTQQLAMRER